MLLDKKRASLFVKIGAGLLAVIFAAGTALLVLRPYFEGGNSGRENPSQSERQQAQYAAAVSQLEESLAKEPQNKDLWIELGNLHFDIKNFQGAVTAYTKAVELDPYNLNVRSDLGTAYSYLEKWTEAKQQFELVLKDNPNHLVALYNLGVVAAQEKKTDEAESYWKKVIKLAPQSEVGKAAKANLSRL